MTFRFLLCGVSIISLSTACVPTMPTQLAESTEVQRPGHASVSLIGGGAGMLTHIDGLGDSGTGIVGGEARVRVGVAEKQEVGLSAFGGVGSGENITGGFGGKLAYKVAPLPWLAFVANGGAMDYIDSNGVHNPAFGGDLAAIVAPYTDSNGSQLYTGVRGAFVVPRFTAAHGASESVTLPVGFMLHASERVRLFIEGGAVIGFGQLYDEKALTSSSATTYGGYGTLGVQFDVR